MKSHAERSEASPSNRSNPRLFVPPGSTQNYKLYLFQLFKQPLRINYGPYHYCYCDCCWDWIGQGCSHRQLQRSQGCFKEKFGDKSDLVDAVEQLEKKPDSEARKATVQEEKVKSKH